MKKSFITVLLLAGTLMLNAQDLKEIKTYVTLRQYPKAKESVDKFLSNDANAKKAEAWYYKAFVYQVLSKEENTPSVAAATMLTESYNALKKYRELDPKAPLTTDEENVTAYNIYYGLFDLGVKAYNGKNYEESYTDFKGALDVHDYVYGNNLNGPKSLKFNAMDTDVVWNMIILGTELKKGTELNALYKKIIDANMTDSKYLQVYQSIVLNYKDAKDQANFDLYLDKGKKAYPKESWWEAVDIENATQDLSGAALFKKYDELTGKYPNSYVLFFNYAIELNRYVNADENKALPDLSSYKAKVPDLIKKAISINSTADANMLLANFYYNNSFDLTEAAGKIKGAKPDDVKKRTELTNASKKSMDDCIPYSLAAIELYSKMTKLKNTEKSNYKQAYDMLSEVYRAKGDAAKSAEYKSRRDAVQ